MAQGTDTAMEPAERASGRAPSAEFGEDDRLAINPAIERLTRWLALAGGWLMLVAIVLTLISVTGRYAFNTPLPGDYESIEIICAVGIFLFFPYTHATNSNIVVRFFTAKLAQRYQRILDLLNDIVFTGVAALLAWRLAVGLGDKFHNGESTMLVRIPFWWSYSFAVASMVLLCIVCIARIAATVRALRQ
jgi:TRAP-type C4-dicarboxylate transport system permease small subunit